MPIALKRNKPSELPGTLQRWLRYELLLLAVATPVFLALVSPNIQLYMTLAGLFLLYILITARYSQPYIWPKLEASAQTPRSIAYLWALLPAVLGSIAFAIYAAWQAQLQMWHWLLSLALYCLWAAVQQSLFQFYLLGRLKVFLAGLPILLICAINGLLFSLVHWPKYELILLTIPLGCYWSYLYWRDRLLLPLALAHGLLATSYYTHVLGVDLWQRWLQPLVIMRLW